MLKSSEPDLVESVERLIADNRDKEREIERLKSKIAQAGAGDLAEQAREVNGVKVIAAQVDGLDRSQLRSLVDSLRGKLGSGVVVLGSANGGDVALICGVTKDLAGARVHAGKLIGAIAQELGGRGGGRPDLAEAGGKDAAKLGAALQKAYELIG
jgi:alanyl-tRNA synthetase